MFVDLQHFCSFCQQNFKGNLYLQRMFINQSHVEMYINGKREPTKIQKTLLSHTIKVFHPSRMHTAVYHNLTLMKTALTK